MGPGRDEEERWHEQCGEFEPVLEGLDEGDAAHAACRDRPGDDDGHDQSAHPVGCAGEDLQGEARALELGQEIEPADTDDEEAGEPAHGGGLQPGLGEVGEGVGPGTAEGRSHQYQQDEVAGGVSHRIPEHVRPLEQHQPRDAEEGRGGEVLTADGRRVEAGFHRA